MKGAANLQMFASLQAKIFFEGCRNLIKQYQFLGGADGEYARFKEGKNWFTKILLIHKECIS